MTHMTLADFEALYRDKADPWHYRSSHYERRKYAATLDACGRGPFDNALELGGSIGVFTALLAPRCRRLTMVDGAATAVLAAKRALAAFPQAQVLEGEIPGVIPDGAFDLVVASEILYYLDEDTLTATLACLHDRLEPGARLVAVHWRPVGPDRPFSAEAVHARLAALPWLARMEQRSTDDYLLEAFARV